MESILTSVKKLCGIGEDYTHYDEDMIMYINNVFTDLARLGVGPATGFSIRDSSAEWTEFLDEERYPLLLNKVKTYVKRKCQLQFDPPQSSTHLNALKEMIAEDEWRLVEIAEAFEVKEKEESENGTNDVVMPISNGVLLTDRTTNAKYELYVDESKLTLAEEE